MSNEFAELLGIETPIVLAPFGGMSEVEFTASISNLGGLGSFGLTGFSADQIVDTCAALRQATDCPFAVNIWLPTGDEVQPEDVDLGPALAAAAPIFAELGTVVPAAPKRFQPSFEEQIDAVLEARPPVLSTVFGAVPGQYLQALRAAGILLVGTATSVAEAEHLAEHGADAVVAMGAEAGGHRVSFLGEPQHSLIGGMSLIPRVVDAVSVPVIAAGGIADRRGVAAAFALGALGVQVGTAFLGTSSSGASAEHRAAIANARDDSTVLTAQISGRLARGITNRAVREFGQLGLPFPAQNWLTGQLRAAARRQGSGELQGMWAGQSAGLASQEDRDQLFAELQAGVPAQAS